MNRVESGGSIIVIALKTVIKAIAITAIALLALALFVTYGNVSEAAQSGCIIAATVLSVFLAGLSAARRRAGAGWLSGLIAGVIYVIIMLVAGFLVFGDFSVGADTLKMFALSIISGIAGGILGVNIKAKRKRK
ncbi:MAG: TIGR04086 family membrane protein [Clostridia bacterium]|nr:TIGR04086 family membrane protein [Clostridia bacterium]MBQ7718904.1 TIGR04086 family membrane protein [Clostridia bacterium]